GMKLLLDTHVFIWPVDNPLQISQTAMDLMRNPENELLFSVGSMWEIAIKVSKDKLPLSIPYRPWLEK
ncbi:MAG: type II toxin-antitoxin system VapC family toxin, partial [Planctomycetia bacterium]